MMSEPVPTVSIVVPMYNAEAYVRASVERLLAQSFRDFELILVDDKSRDSTASIALELSENDSRIHVVELAENGGVANARNIAVERTRGQYVWFVDIDDEWSDDFLTQMYGAGLSTKADMVVCSAVHRLGEQQTDEYVVRYRRRDVLDGLDATRSVLLGSGALWNKLLRREVLGIAPFPPLRSKSDHGGMLRIMGSIQRVATVPDALYTYVQRDGSISNGGIAQPRNFLSLLDLADDQLDTMPSSRTLSRLRSRFRTMILGRALRESWRFAEASDPLTKELPRMVRWRDVLRTALGGDRRSSITCAAAKISPELACRGFRFIGRRRWTPQGGGAATQRGRL